MEVRVNLVVRASTKLFTETSVPKKILNYKKIIVQNANHRNKNKWNYKETDIDDTEAILT